MLGDNGEEIEGFVRVYGFDTIIDTGEDRKKTTNESVF